MAKSDYRCCDVCDDKVFYDAKLNYDFDRPPMFDGSPRLDYLGDWAVICETCAETYTCVVVPRTKQEAGDAKQ